MQTMDLADDIAYSTYDLEDAMKAGFTSPLELLAQVGNDTDLRQSVARKIFRSIYNRDYPQKPAKEDEQNFQELEDNVIEVVFNIFKPLFVQMDSDLADLIDIVNANDLMRKAGSRPYVYANIALTAEKYSRQTQENGYSRALLTSRLIGERIGKTDIDVNEEAPALSKLTIPSHIRFEIDVIKHLTYEIQIKAPRMKLIDYRGGQIVKELFESFRGDREGTLLPVDWRKRLKQLAHLKEAESLRMRLISDYIAGMTDAYALDLYARLTSSSPAVLFRPI